MGVVRIKDLFLEVTGMSTSPVQKGGHMCQEMHTLGPWHPVCLGMAASTTGPVPCLHNTTISYRAEDRNGYRDTAYEMETNRNSVNVCTRAVTHGLLSSCSEMRAGD